MNDTITNLRANIDARFNSEETVKFLNDPDVVVLGVAGKKGAGKTTFCNRLEEKIEGSGDGQFHLSIEPFAEPLKEAVSGFCGALETSTVCGFVGADRAKYRRLEEAVFEDKSILRKFYQYAATGVVRDTIDHNYWIHKWMVDKLEVYRRHRTVVEGRGRYPLLFLIDDVRFVNEAQFIRRFNNNMIIKLLYDGVEHSPHISENVNLSNYVDITVTRGEAGYDRAFDWAVDFLSKPIRFGEEEG